jgi:transcriptional regulator with XRE-family HTH domain
MQDDTTHWYDDNAATFGDRLTVAREQAGLTQTLLAGKIGVKDSTLQAWEEDRKEPRGNRIQMLAGLLNISLGWLLTGRGQGPDCAPDDQPTTSEVNVILSEMRRLRSHITQMGETLGQLELRLRKSLKEG